MSTRETLELHAGMLAAAAKGELVTGAAETPISGFSIDSRRVSPGDLFVAIRGARFDGHQFVREAVARGAVGIVVSDPGVAVDPDAPSRIVIVVPDTLRALQLLGQFVRRASATRVVAITGSVGKTTTKELSAALLAHRYRVYRSAGNLNNHIGVPLSLLELCKRPEVAVLELGMSHAGEIRTLVQLAEPEVRVWTNVAAVHSAFFASIEAIADAKAELLEGATAATRLVANAADPRVMARTAGFPGQITTFAVDAPADVSARDVRNQGLSGMSAQLRTPAGDAEIHTPLLGRGNVGNLLAAVTVALQFQVPLDVIVEQLSTFAPAPRRGQVRQLGPVSVIDDSYNSNPMALEQALETLGAESGARRRVAVLGEMLELGDEAAALHERCGQAVVDAGVSLLVAIGGENAQALVHGASKAGLSREAVATFATSADAAAQISTLVRAGDLVLVKGSRGIETDMVVDRLAAEWR